MKLAIITGASRGLGKALLQNYKQSQWEVYDLSRTGNDDNSIPVDFSQPEDLADVTSGLFTLLALQEWEEIHLILNAATLSPIELFHRCSSEEIDEHITINITSQLMLIQSYIRFFAKHIGRKVLTYISSGAAKHGRKGWTLYSLSKAGMDNAIDSIALEQDHRDFPFEVVTIDPGIMDTAMQKLIRSTDIAAFPDIERFRQYKEEGMLKKPEEVAKQIRKILKGELLNGKRFTNIFEL